MVEALCIPHRQKVDALSAAEGDEMRDSGVQSSNKSVNDLNRRIDIARLRRSVDGQCLLQVPEHADVVDDQSVVLLGEDPVGAGNRLHQGVVAHRPIEIDRRDRRCVEAGHPHRAHEYDPQRVVGVLELLGEVLAVHPLAVRTDVEAKVVQLLEFVLPLRDDHRHVSGLHQLDPGCEPGTLQLRKRVVLCPQVREMPCQGLLDEFIHPHGCGLVEADIHRLAAETPSNKVVDEVLGDLVEPLWPGEQRVLRAELASQLAFRVLVELGGLQEFVELVGEVRIGELQLGDAVLVVQRDGSAVFDGVTEVVGADVVAELLPSELLAGYQRRAGEAHH